MTKKKIKRVCCERFLEAYQSGDFYYAYEDYPDIDETEWFIGGLEHIYYCPFCGAFIKGYGFGAYDEKYPPGKDTRIFKQRKKKKA